MCVFFLISQLCVPHLNNSLWYLLIMLYNTYVELKLNMSCCLASHTSAARMWCNQTPSTAGVSKSHLCFSELGTWAVQGEMLGVALNFVN